MDTVMEAIEGRFVPPAQQGLLSCELWRFQRLLQKSIEPTVVIAKNARNYMYSITHAISRLIPLKAGGGGFSLHRLLLTYLRIIMANNIRLSPVNTQQCESRFFCI